MDVDFLLEGRRSTRYYRVPSAGSRHLGTHTLKLYIK